MSDPIDTVSDARVTAAERRARDVFAAEVAAAMVELARSHRFEVLSCIEQPEPAHLVGDQVAGIIGCLGSGFGGTITLRAPSTFAGMCLPLTTAKPSIHMLGDWVAELTNQLIGRTKNRLLPRCAGFQIARPRYAIADHLLVFGGDPSRTSWITLTTTAGPVVLVVELHTAADFAFSEPIAAARVAHAEGELLLF